MATSGGPKLKGIGRSSNNLVLCLDARDANSYAGQPVTNLVTSSAVDFSVRSTYTGNTFSQVVDNDSPSGYACEMSYTGTVNSASRCKFGAADNIPTSGSGFVSIWAKKIPGTSSTAMTPRVYTGYTWYDLDPLDGGSIYFTDKYRPFGKAVNFGTASGGPNPGFSMTHGGGSTENDKTRWIKPQVTTLSYNVPFANLSRSSTDGWVDLSKGANDGTLANSVGTGTSNYKYGQVISPIEAAYLDFDGLDDYINLPHAELWQNISQISYDLWFKPDVVNARQGLISSHAQVSGANNDAIEIEIESDGTSFVGFRSTNGTFYAAHYNSTLSAGVWYNLTAVVDPSGKVLYYLNGTQVGQNTSWPGGNVANSASETLLLARYATYYFNGKIGSFKAYNKALTAAEIKSNFNQLRSRFEL